MVRSSTRDPMRKSTSSIRLIFKFVSYWRHEQEIGSHCHEFKRKLSTTQLQLHVQSLKARPLSL